MTRAEAAAHLGVSLSASPDEVRQAWRMWARLAHPDRGGNAEHFVLLRSARDVLLEPADAVWAAPDVTEAVPVRSSLRSQLIRPPRRVKWTGMALIAGCIALSVLPGVIGSLTLVLTAAPAAIAATGTTIFLRDRILAPSADIGHRITALVCVWTPLVSAQVVVAQIFAISLITVLPLFALPFVASVAATNPGAGLWRRPI